MASKQTRTDANFGAGPPNEIAVMGPEGAVSEDLSTAVSWKKFQSPSAKPSAQQEKEIAKSANDSPSFVAA